MPRAVSDPRAIILDHWALRPQFVDDPEGGCCVPRITQVKGKLDCFIRASEQLVLFQLPAFPTLRLVWIPGLSG